MWAPSGPGRGSLWWSTGTHTHAMYTHIHTTLTHSQASVPLCLDPACRPVCSRHQRNGAVIARCSQPEISWWGWRNTEDEYLVTSIAKACLLDPGTRTCGPAACRAPHADGPDGSESDFGKTDLPQYTCSLTQPPQYTCSLTQHPQYTCCLTQPPSVHLLSSTVYFL